MNETVTRLISEAAIEVGGRAPRPRVGKLSQETKDLIKKQSTKVSNSTDQIELAEPSKLINKMKVRDIRNYNVGKIEEAVKKWLRHGISEKKKLGIGQGKMYAVKYKNGDVISNFDDIATAVEELYADLYSTQSSHATFVRRSEEQDTEAPSITSDKVRSVLQKLTRGKAAREDGITVDLIKDGGDMFEKLAALYMQCLTTSSVPESWKNSNIILIHNKRDVKEFKN